MATLASPESTSPPPLKRRTKSCARKCERYCCNAVTYFPLAFVYGLTSWAVWVEAGIGFRPSKSAWTGLTSSLLGIALYTLLNWSYTVAVFTDPGSPLTSTQEGGAYSHLPSSEPSHEYTSLTVSSTGAPRYCKKCLCPKPDRAHHCSTCKRCVLKMDHHCPWLATCVGLHNYKSFLLFLIYTCLFCWICFAVTAEWVWTEVISDSQYTDTLMPINYVVLAVISGIIGLVLSGFTAWHLSLAFRGMTTIECLEKTRYLSPLRRTMQRQRYDDHSTPNGNIGETLQSYGQQFLEIHANTIPGVTRTEEGEERPSPIIKSSSDPEDVYTPAQQSLSRSYAELERSRERDRYQDYLDEKESEILPNAFDLGWRRNLKHLFGEKAMLWFLPVCNTTGDGWRWDASPKWLEAREDARIRREERLRKEQEEQNFVPRGGPRGRHLPGTTNPTYTGDPIMGQHPGHFYDGNHDDLDGPGRPGSGVSMQTLRRPGEYDSPDDGFETSSDEGDSRLRRGEGGSWGRQKVVGAGSHGSDQRGGNEDEWRDWD